MGRNKSRSRSNSKRREKKNKEHKERDRKEKHRERPYEEKKVPSRSRSKDADKRRISRRQKTNWSDAPPPSILKELEEPPQKVAPPLEPPFVPNDLISINKDPNIFNQQNELQEQQKFLFTHLLNNPQSLPQMNAPPPPQAMPPPGIDSRTYQHLPGVNPNIVNTLNDASKIKRKIYIPKDEFHSKYAGLIIGPKGANQKRLEEETGCKILVRGKGSQKDGQPPQPDDDEDQHVLIVGDQESQVEKARAEIERIIFAPPEIRTALRQKQLEIVALHKNTQESDPSLTTPYGPPSEDAFIIKVPNDCVGLVIGKSGETIRMLQQNSGAIKVQVARDSAGGAEFRNVFVEGDSQAYNRVKQMIDEIVEQQQKLKQAQSGATENQETVVVEVPVPDDLVGLIIGKSGENIKAINQQTGAFVFIPKECEKGKRERVLRITGRREQAENAKTQVLSTVFNGQKNKIMKTLQTNGMLPFLSIMMSSMSPDEILNMDPGKQAQMQIQLMEMMHDPNAIQMLTGMMSGINFNLLPNTQGDSIPPSDGNNFTINYNEMDQNFLQALNQNVAGFGNIRAGGLNF